MLKKLVLSFSFICLIYSSSQAQWQKYTFETQRMGSPFRITISCQDTAGISKAIKRAFRMAAELEAQLSDYQATSELSQVNLRAGSGEFYPIHEPLRALVQVGLDAQQKSGGALSIFVGKAVGLWRQARKQRVMPDVFRLHQIATNIQGPCLEFSNDSSAIRLLNADCQLDVGSLGKGFVAQRVMDDLVSTGWPYVLVDAGGKLSMTSQNPSDMAWQVALEVPVSKQLMSEILPLKQVSVATSGKTYQSVELDGKSYSHVMDPRTGMALQHARSATAIAGDGALADWLATAATVMNMQEIEKLLVKLPNVRLLVFENIAGEPKILFNYHFYQP